jgi:hypothetical protein
MQSEFIRKLNEYNLSTWFILPLLALNRQSFNLGNFIDSYITKDGKSLVIKVADLNICRITLEISSYPGLFEFISIQEQDYLVFPIDARWRSDIELFILGKYSQFSAAAKSLIRLHSGLKYQVKDAAGNLITDALLMALEKHQSLKQKWIDELGLSNFDFPEDAELLSPPSKQCFIDLNLLKVEGKEV